MVSNLDLLANSVNKYLVTPLNSFGLGGFVFDVEGETTVNLQSEITDHYLEDNSAVQDHIAVRPKKITLKSYVGEVVFEDEGQGTTFVKKVTRKLTVLNDSLPVLTSGAAQVLEAKKSDRLTDISLDDVSFESVNNTLDYWGFIKNTITQTSRQQQAYTYLKALMEGKFLVSVQTPFEFMSNMAIESIVAIQPENSRFISDFSITMKQIRTVDLLSVLDNSGAHTADDQSPEEHFQGRSFPQNQALDTIGNVDGLDATLNVEDISESEVLILIDNGL